MTPEQAGQGGKGRLSSWGYSVNAAPAKPLVSDWIGGCANVAPHAGTDTSWRSKPDTPQRRENRREIPFKAHLCAFLISAVFQCLGLRLPRVASGKAGLEEEARAMVTGETGIKAPECLWQGG
jgi:hypothetical protein